jgi:hypothetical protein
LELFDCKVDVGQVQRALSRGQRIEGFVVSLLQSNLLLLRKNGLFHFGRRSRRRGRGEGLLGESRRE